MKIKTKPTEIVEVRKQKAKQAAVRRQINQEVQKISAKKLQREDFEERDSRFKVKKTKEAERSFHV